jgi:hypothetical protein
MSDKLESISSFIEWIIELIQEITILDWSSVLLSFLKND